MTPLDAVAAAIRERLLAGRPAPLPGLGTLVRQHVASRIQERADGTRMLMPPGETIGLAPQDAAEHESLGLAFGRFRGLDGAQAVRAYRDAMDQVEARLSATGEVRLPGVGLLRRTSGGVILGVEADLLAAVNRTYEGLAPVGTAPPASAAPASATPPEDSADPDPADLDAGEPDPPSAQSPDVEVTVVGSSQDDAFGIPIHSAPEADDVAFEIDDPLRDLSSDGGAAAEDHDTPAADEDTESLDPETQLPMDREASGEGSADAEPEGAEPEGAEPEGAEPEGAEPEGAEPEGADTEGADTEGADTEGADTEGADTEGADTQPVQSVAEAGEVAPEGSLDERTSLDDDEEPESQEPSADAVVPDTAPGLEHAADDLDSDEPPADEGSASPAFVDEDTLDADLDELAVPFGAGAPLSDLLPPTPSAEAPSASWSPPDAAPENDEDSDSDETVFIPAVSVDPFADGVAGDEIEDASYEVIEHDAGPVIERVGPSAHLDALLAAPAPLRETTHSKGEPADPLAEFLLVEDPAVPVASDASPSEPVATSGTRFPWWLIALALALALALLVAWLWPRFAASTANATAPTEQTVPEPTRIEATLAQSDRDDAAPAQPQTSTRDATLADVSPDEPEDTASESADTAPPIRSAPRPSGGGVARDDDPLPARPGLGQAPSAGYAISPPRVVGLPGDDVRALSGRDPVDAAAEAWTIVVLSTTSRDDANALSARYRSAGYRTGVVASTDGNRSIYRVAVGQFSDREQARRLSDRLPPQAPADSWPLDLRTL